MNKGLKSLFLALAVLAVMVVGYTTAERKQTYELIKVNPSELAWALGEDYGQLPIHTIDDVWNERHGDIFVLYGSDDYQESLRRMIEAAKETVDGPEVSEETPQAL